MNENARWLRLAWSLLLGAASCSSQGSEQPTGPETTDVPTAGAALAIGLNSVDPAHYGGWSGPLGGCEPDARDMRDIATDAGLPTTMLLTAEATRQNVLNEIAAKAATLVKNDLFVLSYSGHGGQIPDVNGDDSDDGLDETWCLFDGELIDDELNMALAAFAPGVRVLVFSDSCHSGTVVRMTAPDFTPAPTPKEIELQNEWATKGMPVQRDYRAAPGATLEPMTFTPKAMPPDIAIRTYRRHKAFYDEKGSLPLEASRGVMNCQVILISGCKDSELSSDIGTNGLFTRELRQVWNGGSFSGGHKDLQAEVRAAVLQANPSQSPDWFTVGDTIAGYEAQRPYKLFAP